MTPTVLKTMRLRTDIIEKVEAMAKAENRNFTNMVETILMREIDDREKLLKDGSSKDSGKGS